MSNGDVYQAGRISTSMLGVVILSTVLLGISAHLGYRLVFDTGQAREASGATVEQVSAGASKRLEPAVPDTRRMAANTENNAVAHPFRSKAKKPAQAAERPASTLGGLILTPEMERQLLAQLPQASQNYQPQSAQATSRTAPIAVALWSRPKAAQNTADAHQMVSQNVSVDPDLNTRKIQAEPRAIAQLRRGDRLILPFDEIGRPHEGVVTAYRARPDGISVTQFDIDDGNPMTNGQIVSGEISTDVNVVTESGAYTATIDNQTGEGLLLDDAELKRKYQQENDMVIVPSYEPEIPPDGVQHSDAG